MTQPKEQAPALVFINKTLPVSTVIHISEHFDVVDTTNALKHLVSGRTIPINKIESIPHVEEDYFAIVVAGRKILDELATSPH